MDRIAPTFQNVQWDALNYTLEHDREFITDIRVSTEDISAPCLEKPLPLGEIHEIKFFRSQMKECVPRRSVLGGAVPLYYGTAIVDIAGLEICPKTDVETPLYFKVCESLECKLSGANWPVLLPNQSLRAEIAMNFRNIFLQVAPIVRENRINYEYDRIMHGIPLDLNGIVLHNDKVEHMVAKPGAFNSILGRKEPRYALYDELKILVEGDLWFSPKSVSLEFQGHPEQDLIWQSEQEFALGKQYMVAPLIERINKSQRTHSNASGNSSVEDRLRQLTSLHEQNLITDEEFGERRKTILDSL